jgi:hypothetical protein
MSTKKLSLQNNKLNTLSSRTEIFTQSVYSGKDQIFAGQMDFIKSQFAFQYDKTEKAGSVLNDLHFGSAKLVFRQGYLLT